jgi:hypothetical protein
LLIIHRYRNSDFLAGKPGSKLCVGSRSIPSGEALEKGADLMSEPFPAHVPVALDPVHLQAPALALKGQVSVPGVIAAFEDDHAAYRGWHLRDEIINIL